MENGSSAHKWGLIICGAGMYLLVLTATILMYVFYTKSHNGSEDCGLNKALISINLI